MSLDLAGAATLEIGRLPQPVLTEYELGRLLFDLYDKKQVEGLKIGRLKNLFRILVISDRYSVRC